jgi:integrase
MGSSVGRLFRSNSLTPMELPAVSERLGHSSVLVTATVYAHRITGRDKEAAARWDEFPRSHEQPERKQ